MALFLAPAARILAKEMAKQAAQKAVKGAANRASGKVSGGSKGMVAVLVAGVAGLALLVAFIIGSAAVGSLSVLGAVSGSSAAASQSCVAGAPVNLPQPTGQNEQDVWNDLKAVGYSEAIAAGIMGNMQSESGFNPFIIEGGGQSMNPADAGTRGYGLVQWTPGAKLIPFLHGAAPSIGSEIAGLAEQLQTSEKAAGDALLTATTPEQAADTFGLKYERYAGPPQPARAAQARVIFNWYTTGAAPTGPVLIPAPVPGAGPAPVPVSLAADPCSAGLPPASGDAAAVIAQAQKWFGTPYSWGGGTLNGPSEGFAEGAGIIGFDCSSFVRYAFFNGAGITLPRTAAEQFAATAQNTIMLTRLDQALLQPGDLMFWGATAGSIHHVAMYAGAGMMIDEPHTGGVAQIIPVYVADFFGATRVLVAPVPVV